MNDCLYELYKCAVKENYADAEYVLFAAHCFDEEELFEKVLDSTFIKFVKAVIHSAVLNRKNFFLNILVPFLNAGINPFCKPQRNP